MSIYDKQKIKKLADNQLNNDLGTIGEKLSNKEFKQYFQLTYIIGREKLENKWHFYLTDDIYEKLIFEYCDTMGYYVNTDFSTTEYLELLFAEKYIKGFYKLSKDLWIINDSI